MTGYKALLRRSGAALALTASVLAVVPALAQTYTFGNVSVEGNRRIETGTILTQLGVETGRSVSASALNEGAQRLRETGLFESVDIVPQGGTLAVKVTEYPTINRINFEGNSRLKDDRLAAVIDSTARRVYNPNQAEADARRLSELYASEGRINATVTPSIIRREDNRVDLVFQVSEGAVTEIQRISFVGNSGFSDGRLRRVLSSKQAGLLHTLLTSDTYVAQRVATDRRLLTDFYASRGYVDFKVENVDVALTRERDAYHITFNVYEGPRYRIGAVKVSSALPEADAAIFEDVVRLGRGDVYSPTSVDNDISRIENLALRRGLNFVRVEPRVTRNPETQTLDVEYALVRGQRVFIERIDIEGNTTTLDRVVRSQFRAVEGDPFNPREIRESAERIRALGYFAGADVNARPGSAEDQVVIDVDVTEQPTGTLSFGANFGSDDGFALTAGISERNFLGRGQQLNFSLSTGESNRNLSLAFGEPNFLGRDLRAGLDLSYRDTNYDDSLYNTRTFRFSPSLAFPISERGRLSLNYSLQYAEIDDVSDSASLVIKNEAAEEGAWSNSIGYSYTWDSRRNGIDQGAALSFRFGQDFGVGDKTYIRTSAMAKVENDLLGGDLNLSATLEGGYLHYSDGASRVTDRFFMGSRVMRGFERGGLGPRDAQTDDALGGNAFGVLRLEAAFPLGIPEEYGISGGAFVDVGSLWEVGKTVDGAEVLYDESSLRSVAGVSVFWTTPLGPLRFNFSKPIEAEEYDKTRSFELTVSTNF